MVKRPFKPAFRSATCISLRHTKSNELQEDDKPTRNSAMSL